MSATPEIAVVVPTYGRPDLLPRMIAALEAQTLSPDRFEAIIVDDGSTDDTSLVLEKLGADTAVALRTLRLEPNRGAAAARNAGWQASAAPLLAFTDDDCVPEPGWLDAGLAVLEDDTRIGIVQGRTLKPRNESDHAWTDWTIYREIKAPTPWFEGCNLFFRREAMAAVGGFDETIGWFGEETALGWGVLAEGWERAFADDAVVRHDLVERGWRWHLRHRYLERNVVGIMRRYPAMRDDLWRPWAKHPNDVLFALAVAGVVLSLWKRPALVLAGPYLRLRRPPLNHPRFFQLYGERIAVDTAGLLGHLEGSIRHRRLFI
ncbi:MAG: glycosyltransferase family 2 protein [Acidimicrobiales bacterium]